MILDHPIKLLSFQCFANLMCVNSEEKVAVVEAVGKVKHLLMFSLPVSVLYVVYDNRILFMIPFCLDGF